MLPIFYFDVRQAAVVKKNEDKSFLQHAWKSLLRRPHTTVGYGEVDRKLTNIFTIDFK